MSIGNTRRDEFGRPLQEQWGKISLKENLIEPENGITSRVYEAATKEGFDVMRLVESRFPGQYLKNSTTIESYVRNSPANAVHLAETFKTIHDNAETATNPHYFVPLNSESLKRRYSSIESLRETVPQQLQEAEAIAMAHLVYGNAASPSTTAESQSPEDSVNSQIAMMIYVQRMAEDYAKQYIPEKVRGTLEEYYYKAWILNKMGIENQLPAFAEASGFLREATVHRLSLLGKDIPRTNLESLNPSSDPAYIKENVSFKERFINGFRNLKTAVKEKRSIAKEQKRLQLPKNYSRIERNILLNPEAVDYIKQAASADRTLYLGEDGLLYPYPPSNTKSRRVEAKDILQRNGLE